MRGQMITKLTRRQDLCIFCASRYGFELQLPRNRCSPHVRNYRSTTPALVPPANAAVAREEDDEKGDDGAVSPQPSWGQQWRGSLSTNHTPSYRRDSQPEIRRSSMHSFRLPETVTSQPGSIASKPDWRCNSCGAINLPSRKTCMRCNERIPVSPDFAPPIGSYTASRPREPRLNSLNRSPSDVGRGAGAGYERGQRSWNARSNDDQSNQRSSQLDRLSGFDRSRSQYSRDRPNRFGSFEGSTSDMGRNQDAKEMRLGPPRGEVLGAESRYSSSFRPSDRSKGRITPNGYAASYYLKFDTEVETAPQPDSQKDDQSMFTTTTGMDELLAAVSDGGDPSFKRKSVRGNHPTSEKSSSEKIAPAVTGRSSSQSQGGQDQSLNAQMERRSRRYEIGEEVEMPQIAERKHESRQRKGSARRKPTYSQEYDMEDELELFSDQPARNTKKAKREEEEIPARTSIHLPQFISVENLAKALRVRTEEFISQLEGMGFDAPRYDHILDAETSGLIAGEFNFDPVFAQATSTEDLVARPPPKDKSSVLPRPPIVTIMGHVDHGKTTILDWLRKSSVVDSEHGGITQHIGAFSVTMPGTNKQITFLDTPGHAAFLDMRRRGANVTDIVILVVAADDSVKPQTIEAIRHATDAKVPMIVAVNKIDKEDADVNRVKQDLARHGVQVEDYGGDTQVIPVSGKTGRGMEDLEEATITLSEVLDHRAEIDCPAEGWLIESKVTSAGRVATVLVRRGTMRPGDYIVAGITWARIRTLRNDAGVLVDHASPGIPIQIDGWRGEAPTAGLEVLQAESEEHAKEVVDLRLERVEIARLTDDMAAINIARAQEAEARTKVLEWEAAQEWATKRARNRPKDNEGWVETDTGEGPKKVHFVIKADVAGSVEALIGAVTAVGNNEIMANVIRSGVGVITESDIQHLSASGEVGYLISFNQPVDGQMIRLAHSAGVKILDHNIIYKVTDDVKEKLSDELPPLVTQRVVGEAEVAQIFEIGIKKGTVKIAGCRISNGVITRDKKIRVLRKGESVYDGMLHSLKNVKKDVTEMRKGTECGMGFERWEDFEVGDQIQSYDEKKEKRRLY